jgi:hypothetical protein
MLPAAVAPKPAPAPAFRPLEKKVAPPPVNDDLGLDEAGLDESPAVNDDAESDDDEGDFDADTDGDEVGDGDDW